VGIGNKKMTIANTKEMLFKDKYSLVTGASRGFGAELAAGLWEAGSNLLLVSRNTTALESVIEKLKMRSGQTAIFIARDLADPESSSDVLSFAKAHFPRLDLLINNAAIQGPIGPLWKIDWEAWGKTIQVDLLSPSALCRFAAPWMIEKGGGCIINVSGGGATGPRPNFTAYATAKAGLVRFSETLAEELRPHNVRVNCIAPGAMNTTMMDEIIRNGQDRAGEKEYDAALKVRRDGGTSMKQVTDLCLFLASDAAQAVTGKLISAVWDDWKIFPDHLSELETSDIYTLRRIIAGDRGFNWGDK
jgi:NAD(P)-dependent dehydrogenase (short-subunit alcohol dehydrogenase family)